ncbi:MAG: hypothetical protein EPO13_08195 [Actinomycetota bacterium]|nr:MAG: hypothetical protein EPO13_08195 [Actinomycetota bacterium]
MAIPPPAELPSLTDPRRRGVWLLLAIPLALICLVTYRGVLLLPVVLMASVVLAAVYWRRSSGADRIVMLVSLALQFVLLAAVVAMAVAYALVMSDF